MTELPIGWAQVPIRSAIKLQYGKSLPARNRDSRGAIPVYGSAGMVGTHSSALVKGPVLVIGRKGNVGSTYLSHGPCWPIDTAYFARIPKGLLPKYLAYQLQSMRLRELDSSTAIPSLRRESLEAEPLVIAPTAEQRRIVAAIEEQLSRIDAGVAVLDRVRQKVKRMRASMLQRTARPLLGDWRGVTIDESIRVVDYRGRTPPFSETGIPHLRSFNVKPGAINWTGCAYVTPETYDKYMSRGFPEPGDLLFTTEAPMGEAALAPEVQFCMAQRMMLLKPDRRVWLPEYLMYHLQSPWFQSKLQLNATGTTVRGISSRNFRSLELFAPSLEEQELLVAILRDEMAAIEVLEQSLMTIGARGRALRSAILAAAFSGKLVPQDPSDGPASVLLERIVADRASSKGHKPAKARSQRRSKVTA
jgi:type I restriction enzyme S subunit